jgi:DNA polymerase-1
MRRILFDVEGDGLLPELTKLHCICTVDVDTEETKDFGPQEIDQAVEYLATADVLIAHFGLGYDFPALEKVIGFVVPAARQLDTVVLSRLKFPNLKELDAAFNTGRMARGQPSLGAHTGAHTLEAWGIRLNCAKLHTDIEDWSQWTPQIQERCSGDVQTNLKLWKRINPDGMSPAAVELEHRTQRLCNMITAFGWPFDVQAAGELHAELLDEKHKIETTLKDQFGGWWAPKGPRKGLFVPKRDNKRLGYIAGNACTKIEWVEFNPGSRAHIERCLRKLGWEPEEFTDAGNPKLEEEQLDSIAAFYPQARGITRYLMLDKRLGQLANGQKAWLNFVTNDGRIHGSYNPMGTVTSRASHFNPNVGQVPSVASPYGKECRGLFRAPEGFELLGADMDGLEGRCQAHYMAKHDGGAFGEELLSGDPHWTNVQALGLADGARDKTSQYHSIVREHGAKRWYYAWIYGSGKEKSGRIILDCLRALLKDCPTEGERLWDRFFGSDKAPGPRLLKRVGTRLQEGFFTKIPALGAVIVKVKTLASRDLCLPGLDGRVVPVRSEHSAFNALLQSAGAILCKRWMCDAYDALLQAGYVWGKDFAFLGWIHDELQIAVRKGIGDQIGAVITKAAQEAGKPYGFRIRLDSSYKIGANWAQTH